MSDGFVAWVAYSPGEQDRMRQALAAFSETDTRDEFGIGRIRDAIADRLFPGTSTIQTRLRYFLIVPWVYQELAKRRDVTSNNIGVRVDAIEKKLIHALLDGDRSAEGIFGAVSREELKRLPSSVYWNGLRTWGILNPNLELSQQGLHDRWDDIRAAKNRVLTPDDVGVESAERDLWHQLPSPPEGWLNSLQLGLTTREAAYLKGRMEFCAPSVLAHLASVGPSSGVDLSETFVWDAVNPGSLPKSLLTLVDNAKRFSILMHGTGLLYSLDLCELSDKELHREKAATHRAELEKWAKRLPAALDGWTPNALWASLESSDPFSDKRATEFVERWFDTVRVFRPGEFDNARARSVVRDQEERVKTKRSRYRDRRALDRWAGSAGTRQLDFRWNRVRVLLSDLYEGLAP